MQSMDIFHSVETHCFHRSRLVRAHPMVQISTMFDPLEIYELLEARRKELGLSQADVGMRAFGKPENTPIQSLRKGSSPAIDRVASMAQALGLELYLGPVRDNSQTAAASEKEFAHIPLHNASLAAGAGAANGSEEVVDYLAFRRDWLRKIGLSPANAVVARAEGDSMQPSIWHGDLLLIDRSRTEIHTRRTEAGPRRSPIYALLDDGKARIKRIDRPAEDQVILLSDNPDYGPQLVRAETLSIIGKVMWWGHTNRE